MFFINKNYDTNSRLIPANGPGGESMWIGGLKIKLRNYPPLHSRALAVQRFKASGLPLPVLVIRYIYLPTRTHARTHTRPVPALPPPPWWCCNPTTIAGRHSYSRAWWPSAPSLGRARDLFTTSERGNLATGDMSRGLSQVGVLEDSETFWVPAAFPRISLYSIIPNWDNLNLYCVAFVIGGGGMGRNLTLTRGSEIGLLIWKTSKTIGTAFIFIRLLHLFLL